METYENSLPVGTVLDNRYRIESILGEGGFGITYKAHDSQLDYTVVIKEFLPQECAARAGDSVSVQPRTNRTDDYQYGLERFLDEARNLAKFQHPNIVRVSNFINTNGTVYFVMDFAEGEDLSDWLKKHEVLNEDIILKIITPILQGLAEVHKIGLLHRDIKPGNIFMRKQGGPMLIDFGAARQALGEHSKSISAIISQGYAPPEQYTTRGKQGPFTDLYAIGAVLYKLITGKAPIESADRAHDIHEGEPDPMIPATEAGQGKVGDWLLQLTDQMLKISAKDRPQNAEAVLVAIKNKITADVGANSFAQPSQKQDGNKTRVVKSSERFDKKASQSKAATAPASQSKAPIIAAAVVVFAAIGAGGWWFTQTDTGSSANEPAQTKTSQSVKTLAKGNAILYVDSTPEGAEIYLDNILLGQTPYKNQQLPRGEHEIKLSHADAQDHKEVLTLKDNVIVKKQYQLKAASGSISLFSTPEGASIYLDGKDTGKRTPATLEDVATGERKITIRKDNYYPKEAVITVFKGKAIREDLTLEGGHLVEYNGEWLEPAEKEKRVAEAKEAARIAEIRRVDEAKRLAELEAKREAEAKRQAVLEARIRAEAEAKRKKELLTGIMVTVPGGSFLMGSNNGKSIELPVHRVSLSTFKIGKYEVTQRQWKSIMGNNPSRFSGCDDCPVEKVSWQDVQAFISKLNEKVGEKFRLPTESEWEYACRSGGKNEEYCGGDSANSLAWYDEQNSKPSPVGRKQANGLGLHDMSGNVSEWIQDCINYDEDYTGKPVDGSAWYLKNCELHGVRGGTWYHGSDRLRSSARSWSRDQLSTVGFRLAQD